MCGGRRSSWLLLHGDHHPPPASPIAHMWFAAFRRSRVGPTATLSGQWLPQLSSQVLRSPGSVLRSPKPQLRSHVQNVVVVVAVSVARIARAAQITAQNVSVLPVVGGCNRNAFITI